MNKIKAWDEARKKLKIIYAEKGITTCELGWFGCWKNNALSFAHKHKRKWYLDYPELLGDFNETILACVPCHQMLEGSAQLTQEVFKQKRHNENT